ncbi:Flp pilus assembly protein CpaB [Vibrio sp. HA2012]|uniref:Flp pilus assembly protein CpaB n=1 Tax=Vibrio sp. HA2012 TaxID=1971595 RepID=UPI000C2B963D|nr:Flp pilus assembly protein CpaB [Vibrio sp. HA2012]PJC86113.1 Flp pilus assembly protein CpaB [Vibrio sp. HA2012]
MNLRILVPVALIAVGAGLYGLSGRILTSNIPSTDEPQSEVSSGVEIKTVRIWTVNQDLLPGQLVTAELLDAQMVPYDEARLHGMTENEEGTIPDITLPVVEGMVSGETLTAGQWVTKTHFVTPKQERYIELTISEDMVPYAIKVDPDTIVGGVITHGSYVDIIALSSLTQNLATDTKVKDFQNISISPVLMAVRVLKVQKEEKPATKVSPATVEVSLILELSRRQIARLVIAKKIALLEVHKSIGQKQAEQLQANSGDVLPTYRAIKEFRAGSASVK